MTIRAISSNGARRACSARYPGREARFLRPSATELPTGDFFRATSQSLPKMIRRQSWRIVACRTGPAARLSLHASHRLRPVRSAVVHGLEVRHRDSRYGLRRLQRATPALEVKNLHVSCRFVLPSDRGAKELHTAQRHSRRRIRSKAVSSSRANAYAGRDTCAVATHARTRRGRSRSAPRCRSSRRHPWSVRTCTAGT